MKLWLTFLELVSLINVCIYFAIAYDRGFTFYTMCGGLFTFACAYRACWPRVDIKRQVIFDTFASSIMLGRMAATVGEISFTFLYTKLLEEVVSTCFSGQLTRFYIECIPWMLVTAQIFCWLGVLSLHNAFHVIEEILWMLAGFIGMITFYDSLLDLSSSAPTCEPPLNLRLFGLLLTILYVAYMVFFDLPMYVWRASLDNLWIPWQGWKHNLNDALYRRHSTLKWEDWKEEVVWQSGYFSVGVWIALALAYHCG